MKKTLLLACFTSFGCLFAQSPKKALVEHFTQASCPPCAQVNPIIHPILDANKEKVVRITHQVSWPGTDPMNKDNPGEVQNRVTYYGISAVPQSALNGKDGASTELITQSNLEEAYSGTSPYEIKLTYELSPFYNSLKVNVEVKLTGLAQSRAMLRVAVLEKVINFIVPPGTNGEKSFHHVMKKYLPSSTGTSIAELVNAGDTKSFSFDYRFDKLYNFKNLEVAAFIQNDQTKEALQAENVEVEFTSGNGSDALIRNYGAAALSQELVCGTSTPVTLQVYNNGNKTISSMNFEYSANNGPSASYNWTGSITSGTEKTIVLPNVTIPNYYATNLINVKMTKVNQEDDVNPINNEVNVPFKLPISTTVNSKFEFKPFAKADLVRFEIVDENNQIILKDGPFQNLNLNSYPLALNSNNCYKILVYNDHTSLNANFKLYNDQNTLLLNGKSIVNGITTEPFTTFSIISSTHSSTEADFNLYPNPSSDQITIELNENGNASMILTDIHGKLLKQLKLQQQINTVNLDQIENGVYFIHIQQQSKTACKKLIIQH
ncbi:MAG TPA: Omp28-related outer membrane protein [Saprospiraceae bacterium]|nr:Omp28-related outer membrane protein [Saprospiraceae bacterium]